VTTIFPFWVPGNTRRGGYVEMPYTLSQDSTLFVILRHNNIDLWKRKLDWVADHGGMALVNVHPDYMRFGQSRPKLGEYPAALYEQLLDYVDDVYRGEFWHALPRDVARYVKPCLATPCTRLPANILS